MDILSKMSQGKFMFYLQSIEMLRFYTNYNNKDMKELKKYDMETFIENHVFHCISIQLKFHLNMTKLWSWKQKLKMQQFTMNLLCQIRTNLRRRPRT